jgi:putative hydrolase of HD superfamily
LWADHTVICAQFMRLPQNEDHMHLIPVKFLDDLMRLKRIPRSGWISYSISKHDIESVASHSYSVAVIALTMSDMIRLKNQKINQEQVLRMALLHDLSESLTFDISKAYLRYLGRKGSQLKRRLERSAISNILAGLQNKLLARTYRTTLEEYSAAKSPEARIVHCADAVDLLLQIIDYERMGYSSATLDPIWNETKSKLLGCGVALAKDWANRLERVKKGWKHERRRRRPLSVLTKRP